MEFRISEEVWSSKKVRFSHLKVFGCVFIFIFLFYFILFFIYVNIDSDACSKLDAKSKICIFIAMVMRNLASNFGMNKTEKSSEA